MGHLHPGNVAVFLGTMGCGGGQIEMSPRIATAKSLQLSVYNYAMHGLGDQEDVQQRSGPAVGFSRLTHTLVLLFS